MVNNLGMTKIKYYDGSINTVDDKTKSAVLKIISKINTVFGKEFLNGVSFHVTSDFSNLDEHSELAKYLKNTQNIFSHTKGLTQSNENREIYIQESAFWLEKLLNVFKHFSFSANKEIELATAHEIGHQFDYYYGTTKENKILFSQLLKKYPDSYGKNIDLTSDEEKFYDMYMDNNGLSDSKIFKEAILKDLANVNIRKANLNVTYLIGGFFDRGLDIIPNGEDVQKADYSRCEVFAQLFAYAMGTEDSNKEYMLNMFPNTYQVVKNFINQYSIK